MEQGIPIRPGSAHGFALAAAISAGALALCALFYPLTTEDAYITFRYSEHLADGLGIGSWNAATEPVEGYTSSLWMLALAAGNALGGRTETVAKALGLIAHLGSVCLLVLFPLWRNPAPAGRDELLDGDRDVFAIAGLWLGLYLPACFYATSGMEASAFAFLAALALLLPSRSDGVAAIALTYAALVVMRPEGALVGGVLAAMHLVAARVRGRPLRAPIAALIGLTAAFIAATAFRLAWFGAPFPNTYYAKVAGGGALLPHLGAIYLTDWAASHRVWIGLAMVAGFGLLRSILRSGFRANLALASIALLAALYFGYVFRVGGDNPTAFPWWRQFLHIAPVFALIAGVGVCTLTRNRAARFAIAIAAIAVTDHQILQARHAKLLGVVRESLASYPSFSHAPYNPFHLWLSEIADENTVIASATAGELPYVVDAVHIDMLGLNDREIAHRGHFDPDGPVDSKSDIDSVMRRLPDIIVSTLHSGRFERETPRANRILHRGQMEAALLNHPVFVEQYLFVRNAPYPWRDSAVFVRRDYWAKHPLRARLDCVPVLDTAIYPSRSPEPR